MRHGAPIFLALIFAALLNGLAAACKGDKVLFEDDFQERDAAWAITPGELDTGAVAVGQGRMMLRPPAEKGLSIINMAFRLPTSIDICVTVRFVETDDLADVSAGIVFWADGYAENSLFQVRGNGTFWVSRWADRAWQSITQTATTPAFKPGLGQDNRLRLRANGQTVTLFVNDMQVARYRAPAPDKNVQFGVRGGSFGKNANTVEFRDFKVTNAP
ncbi:MAG: hypothetical protein QOF14_3965 [Hyphomicrobiales bacterium]|jgi:hypothetical protein|nr:hypothetical protein [Hyphomicrobiales bacterium]